MVAQCFLSASIQVFHNLHQPPQKLPAALYEFLAGLMKEPLSHSAGVWLLLAQGDLGRAAQQGPAGSAPREGMAQLTPGCGRGLAWDRQGLRKGFLPWRVWATLQPLGKGFLQALGTDKGTWVAQSSLTHTCPSQGVLANGADPQQLQDTALNVSHMTDDPWEGGSRSVCQSVGVLRKLQGASTQGINAAGRVRLTPTCGAAARLQGKLLQRD